MGACRESKEIEKTYERFLQYTRNFDKILWSYCGKNIEKEEYPMSSFSWIEEEFDDLEFMFKSMKDAMVKEKQQVFKIMDDRRRKQRDDEELPMKYSKPQRDDALDLLGELDD